MSNDMLAELAEVVRLLRKHDAGAPQHYLAIKAVEFIRTHHAEIEAMARDAEAWRSDNAGTVYKYFKELHGGDTDQAMIDLGTYILAKKAIDDAMRALG